MDKFLSLKLNSCRKYVLQKYDLLLLVSFFTNMFVACTHAEFHDLLLVLPAG